MSDISAPVKEIGLGGIAVLPDRMRALRGEVVTELAESMATRGPIEPIVVRPAPGDGNGYWSRTVHPLNLISDQGRQWPSLRRPARPKRAHIYELDPHGCYVETEWCDARLFEVESFGAEGALVLDPAAGLGRIPRALPDIASWAATLLIGPVDMKASPSASATGGVFVTPSGRWEVMFITNDDGIPDEVVARNHCTCTFCRQLRAA
jgi:hypothetical protein